MNTQHTPGPWNLQVGVEENRCYVWGGKASPEQTFIAHVYCKLHGKVNRAEEKANARLIAAAPELLEALNAMLAAMNNSKQWANMEFAKQADDAKRLARAAIAKATQP